MTHSCEKWKELDSETIYISLNGDVSLVDNDDPYTINYEDRKDLKFIHCPFCGGKLN